MQLARHTLDLYHAAPTEVPYLVARPRDKLADQGDSSQLCYLVIQGVLCRSIRAPHGKRQIVGFNVTGDVCGNVSFSADKLDYSIEALSPVVFVPIRNGFLSEMVKGSPLLEDARRRLVNADAATSRQWIVNIGQRPAYQRVAHLICEIEARMSAVGLARDGRFKWNGTQSDLGAAVGLSLVHVNKTLSRLDHDGLVKWGADVRITALARLREIAGFDPTYLGLGRQSLSSLILSRSPFCDIVRDDHMEYRTSAIHVSA